MSRTTPDERDAGIPGTVYLLHFATPYKHAAHYTGWAADLATRLASHRAGTGARLMAVIKEAGIDWELARTWENVDRNYERALKNQGGASRMCPLCGVKPKGAA
jgi:predicted GIY-YIG superfamily endonuclease